MIKIEYVETVDFIKTAGFQSGIIFCYHERKYAPAYDFYPKISEDEKLERLKVAETALQEAEYKNVNLLEDKLMMDTLIRD